MFTRCDEKTKEFVDWINLDNLFYSNELYFSCMTYLEAWSLRTVACGVVLDESEASVLGFNCGLAFSRSLQYFSGKIEEIENIKYLAKKE